MLKRTPFRRKQYERQPRSALLPLERCGSYARSSDEVVTVQKDARAMQSNADEERLWAHVRGLPCARCWKEGRTTVSHSNQLIDGKGRGLKAYPWRVAALCVECHAMIDQGKEMKKAEKQEAWDAAHRWTLGELFSRHLVRPV